LARAKISLEEAQSRIKVLSYRAVGEVAKLDVCRADRIGIPEAVLAEARTKLIWSTFLWLTWRRRAM